MQRRIAETLPEVRARLAPITKHELRFADPLKRLREAAPDHRRRKLDAVATKLEPTQHGRQVVACGVDAVTRRGELVVGTDAIEQRRRVEKCDGAVAACPQVELVVLAALDQRRVEAADLAQAVAPDDDRRRVHQVAEQHRREQIAGEDQRIAGVGRRIAPQIAERPDSLGDSLDAGEAVGVVHRPKESVGDDTAIGIHRAHVRPDHPHFGA